MPAPPPVWVSSPPAEPPVVGLIASLSGPYLDPPPVLERINTPIRYSPEQTCSDGDVTDPCDPSTFDVPDNPAMVEATPFLVRAGEECSTFGFDARDYTGRATRALVAVESKMIAAELWTGAQAQDSGWSNAYLASPASDVLSNGPSSPTVALECLEHGLAQCGNGQRGMIHCTRELASRWSTLGSVFRQTGGMLQTYLGTIVVPDAGYDGSAPDGDPAVNGSQWAYATGMVTVRRGPISLDPESLSAATYKKENTVRYVASRLATVSWDAACCHLAVEVDLPLCLIGGAS